MLSIWPESPPVNVSRISFNARLSIADTLKRSPSAMACVSETVLLNVMLGFCVSGWTPPMWRVVSHAQRASAETRIPQSAVPRGTCRMCSPGLLPGGRHQVVDDVGRDQNQEITPVLQLRRVTEQLAQNRQIYKERYSRLLHRDLGHREAADHDRLAVRDEDLVVGLLRLERESEVRRRRAQGGALGVDLHQDLAVGRHVRRHLEVDARLLEAHRRPRQRPGAR